MEFVATAFILALGPLALLFGTDSRLDEARWRGARRR